ncbi:hypothetical protein E1B28_003411 [Marasmius oreades]|uniref:RNA helicase n=1 Tax=Marasmius oreades TaxID=181124 RepID=A0A9P7UKJ8_9AGAR|nr:uncharacterized protein E1B28_003411 [Marasmius oreades]KAG7085878.1 hypothetical protein E1B28_003411 [Marasmius oreades]
MAISSREAHLQGKRHLRKSNSTSQSAPAPPPSQPNLGSEMWTCKPCGRQMIVGNRNQHLQGKSHKAAVKAAPIPRAVTASAVPAASSSQQWTCEPCGRRMDAMSREQHLQGQRHRDAIAQPLSVQVAQGVTPSHEEGMSEEVDGDKNGFTIEGSLDFKIVDLASAARGITLQASVKAKATFRAEIVGCTLASSKGQRTCSPFTVSIIGQNRTVSPSSTVQLKVNMTTQHYGRAEDRLEVTLDSPQLRSQFVIARKLCVHVGDQSTLNDLKPKIPYTPRDKSAPRQPETKIIPGEPAPFSSAFPYARQLPRAKIPGPLANDLSSGTTREIIDKMRSVYLPLVFDSTGYGKHFKHIIWAEEYQMDLDMGHYDMHNAKLRKNNQSYYLAVPGLAEKRPSVLVGDKILVQPHGAPTGIWFEGGVHTIREIEVGMKFNKKFAPKPTDLFSVRFKLNRSSVRRQHQALDWKVVQERVLFPDPEHLGSGGIPQGLPRSTFNPVIANNPRQLQAVTSILHAPAGSVPFVLFGPPGTGKTVTLVESIRQILDANPHARVLACAPSNSAADLIALRLLELGPELLFRAYAQSRYEDQVPEELKPFTHRNENGHYSVRGVDDVKRFRVVVTTCISASIVSGIKIPPGHYSHIFVDEAGQATETEVMVSVKMMADDQTNVVLCGDPKQLGPVIRSSVARRLGLGMSFIERLMGREIYDEVEGYGISVVKLTKNYRSHNAILKFPNEQFYGGDLEPCADPAVTNLYLNSPHVVSPKFPIVFHSVFGKDEREASSPSYFNIDEVTVVTSILEKLRKDTRIPLSDDDIGVIAPYRAQVLKLRAAFRNRKMDATSVKVGSVEEFQGQERKVIIVTTVRSSREFVDYDLRHTLGFVANPRRFNVAVTRARSLLVIVGDPNVLSLDPLWRSFMNYVYENGGWTGPEPTWDTTEPVDFDGGYDVAIRDQARAEMEAFSRMMEGSTPDGRADVEGDVNVDQPWAEMD